MPTMEEHVAAVKHAHDEWWEANADFDIPRLRTCFAKGTKS